MTGSGPAPPVRRRPGRHPRREEGQRLLQLGPGQSPPSVFICSATSPTPANVVAWGRTAFTPATCLGTGVSSPAVTAVRSP